MGTIKATNIEPIADNGTVTLGSSGDQFTLATGAKSSFLYPAFEAYLGSDQAVSDNTLTKIQFNTEVVDSDNCYDNSTNYRFTPTVAGKYFVYCGLSGASGGSADLNVLSWKFYKNGSVYKNVYNDYSGNPLFNTTTYGQSIIDMNGSSDYLEIYGLIDGISAGSEVFNHTNKGCVFGAYRIGT